MITLAALLWHPPISSVLLIFSVIVMKYFKILSDPKKVNVIPLKEEISREEYLNLCESNRSYFLIHDSDAHIVSDLFS